MVGILSLASLNDLFALAVGVNMAYILVNRSSHKNESYSLFSFLDGITGQLLEKVTDKQTATHKLSTMTLAKIEYYLKTNKLKSDTKAVVEHIAQGETQIINKIDNFKETSKSRITDSKCLKSDYMPHLAFDCVIFGMVMLFVSALEADWGMVIYKYVSILNLGLCALVVWCLICENRECKYNPSFFSHSLILLSIIVGAAYIPQDWQLLTGPFWANATVIASVFLSFISLIAYFLNGIIKCIRAFFSCKKLMKKECFLPDAQYHKSDLDSFQEEFDAIDEELGRKPFEFDIETKTETTA